MFWKKRDEQFLNPIEKLEHKVFFWRWMAVAGIPFFFLAIGFGAALYERQAEFRDRISVEVQR